MRSRATALTLLLAAAAWGCGGEDARAPAVAPARVQLLRVPDASGEPTRTRLRIPIARGWSGATSRDIRSAIGGTSREFEGSCSLLVQFLVGTQGGPIGVDGVEGVDSGSRPVALGGRQLEARFRLYRAPKGLTFSGGATGPGAALTLTFVAPADGAVVARLTALGGMDGLECPFGAREAIARTTAVLRLVARGAKLERAPA